jgi:hypothetical protein
MTNKVVLREIEEFMSDYVPVYAPVYGMLLGNSQAYPDVVGTHQFRRVQTVGDIRAHRVTPKDTEIRQVAVNEFKKPYKKYFLANQFTVSTMQDQQGTEEIVARVLDEHQKQMDELVFFGEGTSNSTMLNNGLYWSNDPNFTEESSTAIASGATRLQDFHNKVILNVTKANRIAGRKMIMFFGTDILPLYNSLYVNTDRAWKSALQEVVGAQYTLAEMPAEITPSGQSGWIIINMDQVKLHYCAVPQLKAQGTNAEKMYNWFNFVMGSTMVECLAKDAIIKQPATLA